MYGSSQVNLKLSAPLCDRGFPACEYGAAGGDRGPDRIEAGYAPMHPVDEFREEDCDPDGWYDFYIDITSTAQAGWAAASSSLW